MVQNNTKQICIQLLTWNQTNMSELLTAHHHLKHTYTTIIPILLLKDYFLTLTSLPKLTHSTFSLSIINVIIIPRQTKYFSQLVSM